MLEDIRDVLVLSIPLLVFVVPMVLFAFWQEEIEPRIRKQETGNRK